MKFRLLKPLTILSTLLIILLCFTASASAFFVSSEKIHVGKIFFSDAFFTRNFSPLTAENTPVKNYDDKKFASVSLLVPKSGANLTANSLKEFKQLVKQLSKPDSKITQSELNQLKNLADQYGGKVRIDLKGVKGSGVNPHIHIEGLGSKIESRHIWLDEGIK